MNKKNHKSAESARKKAHRRLGVTLRRKRISEIVIAQIMAHWQPREYWMAQPLGEDVEMEALEEC